MEHFSISLIRWKRILNVCIFLPFAGILIITYSLLTDGLPATNTVFTVNQTLDYLGIVILAVIFQYIWLEIRQSERKKKSTIHFLLLMICNLFGCFFDFYAWRLQGFPEYRLANFGVNIGFYLMGPAIIYMYWLYVNSEMAVKDKNQQCAISCIQLVIFVMSECAILLNIFLPFLFSVDENGVYAREVGVLPGHILPIAIMILLTLFWICRSDEKITDKLLYAGYALIPALVFGIQIYYFGTNLFYIVSIVVGYVIYGNIHLRKAREMKEMRLKILHSQVQPHFMANTLTVLRGMIRHSPEDAIDMTDHFAAYLRNCLRFYGISELVPISQELDFVRNYLEIECLRFGGKIRYRIDTVEEDFFVPPISIQPLVENAIRHGIRKRDDGRGMVQVRITEESKWHMIEILDDGVGFDVRAPLNHGEEHIGIANTRSRIRAMTGGTMEVNSTPGLGTRVRIRIPHTLE